MKTLKISDAQYQKLIELMRERKLRSIQHLLWRMIEDCELKYSEAYEFSAKKIIE